MPCLHYVAARSNELSISATRSQLFGHGANLLSPKPRNAKASTSETQPRGPRDLPAGVQ